MTRILQGHHGQLVVADFNSVRFLNMSMICHYRRLSVEQLATLQSDPRRVPAFLYDADFEASEHLDIDKSWHAIHFLLNGETWEGTGARYDAVLGGDVLGREDVGYGPARFLTPREVAAVADTLAAIPAFELLDRFDAQSLNNADIYPKDWTGQQADLDYITDNYLRLVEFFRTSAARSEAVLLYLN